MSSIKLERAADGMSRTLTITITESDRQRFMATADPYSRYLVDFASQHDATPLDAIEAVRAIWGVLYGTEWKP